MNKKRETSSDTVYLKLKNAIRKRYIKQGSQLVEGVLAAKLGVSRTPVRSSIKQLEAEGLVYTIPNRGAFVVTPSLEEIEETFFVRSQLEQAAARLAAKRITASQIEQLNRLIEKEKDVFDQQDLEAYDVVNDTLHSEIAKFSGNKVLASYVKELFDKTRIYLVLFDPFLKLTMSPSLEAHQRIINALASHDSDLASKMMEEHIKSSVADLKAVDVMPDDYLSI